MDKDREKRYLQISKYIFWGWVIALALFALASSVKAYACSAYLDYEYTDGMSRICVYNHLGTRIPVAYNIGSMCPLSIEVPHG